MRGNDSWLGSSTHGWHPNELLSAWEQLIREFPSCSKEKMAASIHTASRMVDAKEGYMRLARQTREILRRDS
jgi:hypothetical protein